MAWQLVGGGKEFNWVVGEDGRVVCKVGGVLGEFGRVLGEVGSVVGEVGRVVGEVGGVVSEDGGLVAPAAVVRETQKTLLEKAPVEELRLLFEEMQLWLPELSCRFLPVEFTHDLVVEGRLLGFITIPSIRTS